MVRRSLTSKEFTARHWETLKVSVVLLTLLVIFFGQAVFLGRKLLPADIAFTDPVFLPHAPADFTEPHNVLLYDQAYQFYPWRVYASSAVRQGFLPLWNPYVYSGAPFMAVDQPAVLYPLNILSYVVSPPDAVLLTALVRLFIAGLATYWFVRTLGGGSLGALVGAITFAFSGFMIVWLGHPHANVAAWLPAFFLTVEWLYQRTTPRHIALVALTIAAQLTAGHAETALYTLTAGGLYYLLRTSSAWWSNRQLRSSVMRLVALATAAALGAALASVHLLPFLEWLRYSAELTWRTGLGGLRATRLGPKYWVAGLLPMLLPNIFSNPTWPGQYRSFFPGWNFVEQTLYVGILGLPLAAAVLVARRADKRVWLLAALGLAALGAALRLPVFDWINYLPLFNIAAYGRFRLVYSFCVSVLAGLGARDLLKAEGGDDIARPAIWLLVGSTVMGAIVLLIAPHILSEMNRAAPFPFRQLIQEALSYAFRVSNIQMYWPLLVALAAVVILGLYVRRVLRRQIVQPMLLLLVVVDLFALGMGYHTAVVEQIIFPETPALQLLKNDTSLFRIVGTNIDLMPNTGMIYGLHDVRGLDFPGRRYQELCQAIGGRDWLGYGILFTEQLELRLLGLLNVKYVLTSSSLEPDILSNLRLRDVDNDVSVYENLAFLPRAFVVYRAQVAQDSQDILPTLLDPGFDLHSEIVLEKPPPPDFVEAAQAYGAGGHTGLGSPQATVEITSYEPNYVEIIADSPANGFLFLSDSYYPGWKAYLDSAEAEIYQADYAFRAVYLPAGRHTVEFAYQPAPFRVGSIASGLTLFVVMILLIQPWPRRVRDSSARLAAGGDLKAY